MSQLEYHAALQDFRRARHRADLECIVAFLKGKSSALLSYDDVYKQLHARRLIKRELKEISVDAIVGSMSHYKDFTRSFFPKNEHNKERWTAVSMIVAGAEGGLAPIEVYQIGDVYFVYDGNHRVSVARQVGATVIEAYVTQIDSPVPLSADLLPENLILKAEYADFLAHTHLNRLRSVKDFELTIPGKYQILEEQIALCQYLKHEEQQQEIPYEEAVLYWYDIIYLPVVNMIKDLELLRDFPKRTATDLYVWVSEHRSLVRQLGTTTDEPYLTEIWDKIPDVSEQNVDELILQAEYHNFLEHTQLKKFRPDADLHVTTVGKYRLIEEHINVHRYFMGLEQKRTDIPYYEAVAHWYDMVYLPIVRVIQEQQLLDDFPGQTITDLYFWISEHQIISQQIDASHAEVYLTEVWTKVQNFPYVHLDTLIIKVEYIDFLLHTHLNERRPKADLTVSVPGKYHVLEEHIKVHRYFMGIEQKREIPYAEAVEHWYDTVYLPVLEIIVGHHLLREFPDLTATDLYLWISEHQNVLEKQLGEQIDMTTAANDLVNRFGSHKSSPLSQMGRTLLQAIMPTSNDQDTSAAQQQRTEIAARRKEHLFAEILVPLNGRRDGWHVLDQALEIARNEDAYVSGLHIVSSEHQLHSDAMFRLQRQFEQRCHAADVEARFTIDVSDSVAKNICDHAWQADLVVMHLPHSLDSGTFSEFYAKFRRMNQHYACPVFALSDRMVLMKSALLVYDGSPQANEALFISAYLAGCWEVSLSVMFTKTEAALHAFVKSYLKRHGVNAAFVQQQGIFRESLAKIIREHACDFIVLGGYRKHSLWKSMFGSPLDQVRETLQRPILLCG